MAPHRRRSARVGAGFRGPPFSGTQPTVSRGNGIIEEGLVIQSGRFYFQDGALWFISDQDQSETIFYREGAATAVQAASWGHIKALPIAKP